MERGINMRWLKIRKRKDKKCTIDIDVSELEPGMGILVIPYLVFWNGYITDEMGNIHHPHF